MEGDTFETEDCRNWTDASFKTYVRPLARPWPYTRKAGEPVTQSIKVSLSGKVKIGGSAKAENVIDVKLGKPLRMLDFVMNTTCPIVHATDDRSVMETLEALPYQIKTARTFLGKTPHRVGPSAIGCRDHPHGATFTPNPDNERICLAKAGPRSRALFGAAWLLGYIATFAHTGIESLTVGAPTGPRGVIYRRTNNKQPYFDSLSGPAVFPAYHIAAGLMNSAGQHLVESISSDDQQVCCFAHCNKAGTTLWIANLTARDQNVRVGGGKGAMFGTILDESSFRMTTTRPLEFQQSWRAMSHNLTLKPYAVAIISIAD